jgi:G3E family GTPase
MSEDRVPVALVTGFLGSGKTTLLRNLAVRYANRRIAWIVNEFGALDVDGQVLRAQGMEVLSVPGGSILCRCLATQANRVLQSLAGKASAGELDGVIIEASGIARPAGIDRMLTEFSLDATLAVSSITCVVDPLRFSLAQRSLACVTEQVQCSDRVLLNKVDTVDAALLDSVEAELAAMTPAPIFRCAHCSTDIDVLAPQERSWTPGALAELPDSAFSTCQAETEGTQNVDLILDELAAIGGTLYRCKGILRVSSASSPWVRIDWTPGGHFVEPYIGRKPLCCGMQFIAKEGMEGPAQNLARAIRQGQYRLE